MGINSIFPVSRSSIFSQQQIPHPSQSDSHSSRVISSRDLDFQNGLFFTSIVSCLSTLHCCLFVFPPTTLSHHKLIPLDRIYRPALARLDCILLMDSSLFQNRDLEMITMFFSVWARDDQDISCHRLTPTDTDGLEFSRNV